MFASKPFPARILAAAALAGALVVPVPAARAAPPDPATRGPHEPLSAMVRRIDRYLQRHEVDGVTMDWRYTVSPSEEIRQTVVCQVLAYAELHRLHPTGRLRKDIVEHADFMLGRLEEIRSRTPFDGMLAYALLSAYETTGETRFLAAGREVTDDVLAIPTEQCVLNGGLMVAMAAAFDARLTGNPVAAEKAHAIIVQLVKYQNEDGSFPHWCIASRDIHYTGWMAMELIHIARHVDDPVIAPMLARMTAFLESRIGPGGRAVYEEPCPPPESCVLSYYSRATGCDYDYDTRGWTVEPAYCALLFDHQGSEKFAPVFAFLDELEDGGTFADLYDYWPPPEDPENPWTIADTSVVNMSVIFWALTTELSVRAARGTAGPDGRGDVLDVAVAPNPARGTCRITFRLAAAGHVAVSVHDARGRRVRDLGSAWSPAGAHAVAWDGRDERGIAAPAGIYFASLVVDGRLAPARFVRLAANPAP